MKNTKGNLFAVFFVRPDLKIRALLTKEMLYGRYARSRRYFNDNEKVPTSCNSSKGGLGFNQRLSRKK